VVKIYIAKKKKQNMAKFWLGHKNIDESTLGLDLYIPVMKYSKPCCRVGANEGGNAVAA
jgi:hypothetical protein